MNGCEEVREILLAMARGEAVSVRGERFLGEHVESCPVCHRRLGNEKRLSMGLAAIGAATPTPPPAVKTALLAEFRRQRTATPIRRPVVKWIAMGAMAAALLVAVFVAWGRRTEKALPVAPMVKAPITAPVAPVVKAPVEKAPVVIASAAPATPRRRNSGLAKARPAVEEVATDFFEIPYVEPLRPEQRADVFRMQMPRASMAVFGLPVAGGRLDSRITADVLVGEDGVARAIRFIR